MVFLFLKYHLISQKLIIFCRFKSTTRDDDHTHLYTHQYRKMALTTSSTPHLLNDLELSSHSPHRVLRSHNTHLTNPIHLLSFPQINTQFRRPLFNNMPLISSRKFNTKVRASSAALFCQRVMVRTRYVFRA
ncbi:hypothetical protein HanPI659440_Chr04g0143661 [Helianthus annuus]|nr:hypothetical protein HanPI659440_Chr04g0143661 [Helianthus annuus]